MSILNDLTLIAPIWLTACGAGAVLLLTVAGGYKSSAPARGAHLPMVALASILTSIWFLLDVPTQPVTAFSGAIIVDGIGAMFGIVSLVGAGIAILLAESYLTEHEQAHGEFHALILLSAVGMLILAMAGDLMTLFIGIEVMSLAVYVLAGFRRNSKQSQEAALKYFIYGAFASGFVLFGLALIYGEVGALTGKASVGLMAIRDAFAGSKSVSHIGWIGVAMMVSGLAFKVAAVPFHMWTPDVYEGAPTPSAGFMAVGIKAAAFAGMCRFAAIAFLKVEWTETAVQIFEVMAILTMVVGNLTAIRQTLIKRMLAYSSIAHAGYIFVGIAAFLKNPSGGSIEAITYYLLGYTAMTLGAFGVVLAFEAKEERKLDLAIERFRGVGHRYPALGLCMAVFMFSLAGIPPTAGFFGKLAIFSAAVDADRIGVVVIAVLASAAGAYYYLRVLVVMYMEAKDSSRLRIKSAWLNVGLWVCVAITLIAGMLPETYFEFARKSLQGWLGLA